MFNNFYRLSSMTVFVLSILLFASNGSTQTEPAEDHSPPNVTIAVDPEDGTFFKATVRSLYQSRDAGQNWERIPLPRVFEKKGRISSLATPARGKGILYLAGAGQGVFRTRNKGKDWETLAIGLPSRDVIALASHADLPETLYAVLSKNSIYRTQDAGKSWQLMDDGPKGIVQLIHTNMKGSMQTGWLFAATAQGVRRGMDCFCLWRRAGELKGRIFSIAYDPRKPEFVYAASKSGLFRSMDGGEAWVQMVSPGTGVAALVFTPSGILYVVANNGILYRSANDATDWERIDA